MVCQIVWKTALSKNEQWRMKNKISLKFYSIHQIKINITDTKTFVFTQTNVYGDDDIIFVLYEYCYHSVYRTLNSCH